MIFKIVLKFLNKGRPKISLAKKLRIFKEMDLEKM